MESDRSKAEYLYQPAVWSNGITGDSVRNLLFFFIYYLFAPEPFFMSNEMELTTVSYLA
ncbi:MULTISPECIES: hypothetical protein [Bacillus]|uniref:hypothetical protein n=1 Tax=Bacillus TaxID=1386 RepID=UPI00159BE0C3|nr:MULTISPECIES: hypothetical protein [Bacillus]